MRGQYRGYRAVPGVRPDSDVETFVAVKLFVDSWRWAGVPIYIRAGKCLPVTAAEVIVEFHDPPRAVFGDEASRRGHMRMRLSPDVCVAMGLRVKRPGEQMVGERCRADADRAGRVATCLPTSACSATRCAATANCSAGRTSSTRNGGSSSRS